MSCWSSKKVSLQNVIETGTFETIVWTQEIRNKGVLIIKNEEDKISWIVQAFVSWLDITTLLFREEVSHLINIKIVAEINLQNQFTLQIPSIREDKCAWNIGWETKLCDLDKVEKWKDYRYILSVGTHQGCREQQIRFHIITN